LRANDFVRRDVVSIRDFSRQEIDFILKLARDIEERPADYSGAMVGKIMAPLFFEPSTRTCGSFQMAMQQMGGAVFDFDVAQSSIKKGETLTDTARMFKGYKPDVVVIRHNKDGSARLFADIVDFPVINAGDGKNQHPTQTLLDLYTIREILNRIDGANVAVVGDLKYGRTTHSLALALSQYSDVSLSCVAPQGLEMPQNVIRDIRNKNVRVHERSLKDLEKVIREVDILYMTRIQRERFPQGEEGERQYARVCSEYRLTLEMIKRAGPKASFKVLHPLPKVDEIAIEVDGSEWAYYFKQAENGLYIRKALLYLLTGAKGRMRNHD